MRQNFETLIMAFCVFVWLPACGNDDDGADGTADTNTNYTYGCWD